jgi:hypothetical protein
MKYKFLLFIVSSFLLAFKLPDDGKSLNKKSDDDNSKFTNVGNIGLTVTNFGTYGHGFSLWPQQPSCEYPLGSGIEHIFDGGLWIGGFISGDASGRNKAGPFVTTGAVDASSVTVRGGGFEFTNVKGNLVTERSSLLNSKVFSPYAVSHQDFVMDYSDTSTTYLNNEQIVDHSPLGVAVHQECYAWNYPFADFFVIMNYWIKNVTNKYIDSVMVGLWTDTVVRNTNITSPRTGSNFFNKGGNGYNDSLKVAYEYDATGDIGFTDSYIGIQYLGSNPDKPNANFVSWQFKNTDNPKLFAPTNDVERYSKMEGYFANNVRFGTCASCIKPSELKVPSNRSMLITTGPFSSIAPGDSFNVVFAIVAAKKFGDEPASIDNEEQKKNLYINAGWALRAYNGEDKNGNGILDTGEDLNGNGIIDRYILPSPPSVPVVRVIPENNKATIYWDNSSEKSVDPISGKKDFEGYRIYRTNSGADLTQSQDLLKSLVLIGEFDSTGNSIGFNTGFDAVRLREPVSFPGDNTKYYYKFEIDNLLNGWQYTFSVTAFDKGDPANNLESLETSALAAGVRILPGTLPTSDATVEIGVYPNPYYGNAYWDGNSERLRKVYFYNLPSDCEITIYTLAGDIVKRIIHNNNSNGSDLQWFETYAKDGKQLMAGGEQAWDLITSNDQAIATGLYLFTVKDNQTGNIKKGKFLIIK